MDGELKYKIMVIVVVIMIVIITILFLFTATKNTTIPSKSSTTSSSDSPVVRAVRAANASVPTRTINSNNTNPGPIGHRVDAPTTTIGNADGATVDASTFNYPYNINVGMPLTLVRNTIFPFFVHDMPVDSDITKEANYNVVANALRGYSADVTNAEIGMLIKHKNFVDRDDVYSVAGPADIDQLYVILLNIVANKVPGDVVETGTWRGGLMFYAKAILNHFGGDNSENLKSSSGIKDEHRRKMWMFGEFGSSTHQYSKNSNTANAKDLAISGVLSMLYDNTSSAVAVKENMEYLGLLDDNVRIVPGPLTRTLSAATNKRSRNDRSSVLNEIAILRIGSYYYEDVYSTLEKFYPLVSQNGIVIISEYNNQFVGCHDAVIEFRNHNRITASIFDSHSGSVYWIKQ